MLYLLQGYGDFDCLYIKSLWQSDSLIHVPDFGYDREGVVAENWLKSNGFKKVKYKSIEFGGNY